MPHDGHQFPMAARLRPENAKAVLAAMESDPLDEAGENFWVDDSDVGFMRAQDRLFSVRAPPRECRAGGVPPGWAALAEWRLLKMPPHLSGRGP